MNVPIYYVDFIESVSGNVSYTPKYIGVCSMFQTTSLDLPTVQFLVTYSMQRRRGQQSKTGRTKNKAKGVMQVGLATEISDSLVTTV